MLAALYLLKTWTLTCKNKREKKEYYFTRRFRLNSWKQIKNQSKSADRKHHNSWAVGFVRPSSMCDSDGFFLRCRLNRPHVWSIKVWWRGGARTLKRQAAGERRSGAAAIKHGHEIAFVYIVKLLFWGLVVSHSDFFVPRRGKAPWKELPSTVRLA